MAKYFSIIFLLLFVFSFSFSQIKKQDSLSVSGSINFSRYLLKKNKFQEATIVLERIVNKTSTTSQRDSILYLTGYSYLNQKKRDLAVEQFNAISDSAGELHYRKTVALNFYALYNFQSVQFTIKSDPAGKFNYYKDLLVLQQLAYLLLKNDQKAFNEFSSKFHCETDMFRQVEQEFYLLKKKQSLIPKKKQWKAVVLSSAFPGLGKLYAGRKGEALMAFLPVFTNGVQAYEGYSKAGVNSPHLYVFGGIGTVFYFSNLYGAKEAVKRTIDEKNDEIRNEIFRQLHMLDTAVD